MKDSTSNVLNFQCLQSSNDEKKFDRKIYQETFLN